MRENNEINDLLGALEKDFPSETPKAAIPLTDAGNGERFVRDHGANARYSHPDRTWWIWNGKHWTEDKRGIVQVWALETVRKISLEVARQSEEYKLYREFEADSESSSSIRNMLVMAQPNLSILREDLDRPKNLFNLQNGTINLDSFELLPHRREDFLSKIADVVFDPNATCPRWEKFMLEITNGERPMVSFLQRLCGYALGGANSKQLVFLFHGTGANGKTVFVEISLAMFGPYGSKTSYDTFLNHRKNAGQARGDLARLANTRLVVATETGERACLDMGLLKELVGGDTFVARHLYQREFEFKPFFSLWLVSNWKPEVTSNDEATWRRLKLVPFLVTIPKEQRDEFLTDSLKNELPGILNWTLAGLKEYRDKGFEVPLKVEVATCAYRVAEDVIGQFIEARNLVRHPDACIVKTELFQLFNVWAEESGQRTLTTAQFYQKMELCGFKEAQRTIAHGRYRVWLGIGRAADPTYLAEKKGETF